MTLYKAGEIVADYYFAGEDTTPYNWFIELRLSLVSKGPDLFNCKHQWLNLVTHFFTHWILFIYIFIVLEKENVYI